MIDNFILTAIIFFLSLPNFGRAYEIYDSETDRLVVVKWCDPVNDSPSDNINYISCDSKGNEHIAAPSGSICTNYQSECSSEPDTMPIYSNQKTKKPWNYFDTSEPASFKQPSTFQPTRTDDGPTRNHEPKGTKRVPVKKD